MHPLLSDTRRLLLYAAAWLALGPLLAGMLVAMDWVGWLGALLFAVPMALLFGFVAVSAYFVCRSLPYARRHVFLGLAAFGGASLLSSLAWLAIAQLWALALQAVLPEGTALQLYPAVNMVLLVCGCGLYLMSLLAHDVLIAFETLRQAQEREAQSHLLAREAELQMLRTQINPHFLFNSLNSISALTSLNPAGARQMAIQLAQFFRQTLALSDRKKIMLGDEYALCQNFLAIEKVRFGDKLDARWELDPQTEQALLPPMLLQPLLENAIKHGIRDLVDGGTITVQARAQAPWLYLTVRNPVDTDPSPSTGNGLGLSNLRARLLSLYAGQAQIRWERSRADFVVNLALPLEFDPTPTRHA